MMKRILWLFLFVLEFTAVFGQKPVINIDDCGKWPTLGNATRISNDGNYAMYSINNQPSGSQTLVITSLGKNWEIQLPHQRLYNGSFEFSQDNRMAIVQMAGDSLGMFFLGSSKHEYITNVRSYRVTRQAGATWLAYQLNDSTKTCIIRSLASDKIYYCIGVNDLLFDDRLNAIIIKTSHVDNKAQRDSIFWLDLLDGKKRCIWKGEDGELSQGDLLLDNTGTKLAFVTSENRKGTEHFGIWEYDVKKEKAEFLLGDTSAGIGKDFVLAQRRLYYSEDSKRLFFTIQKSAKPDSMHKAYGGITIWNYKDTYLPTDQADLYEQTHPTEEYSYNLSNKIMVRLNGSDEEVDFNSEKSNNKYVLVHKVIPHDKYYSEVFLPFYLESLDDGSRTLITRRFSSNGTVFHGGLPELSPNERYVVWFDVDSLCYNSYNIETGKLKNISSAIPTSVYNAALFRVGEKIEIFGIGGWLINDKKILIYDQYDIWEADPSGVEIPINVTCDIGKREHIDFGIMDPADKDILPKKGGILLVGYNRINKENGFWTVDPYLHTVPQKLIMDGNAYLVEPRSRSQWGNYAIAGVPVKAANANVYLVKRMNCRESTNLFVSSDLRTFKAVSDIHPEKKYNWITCELVTWTLPNGDNAQGLLYKPENFDPTKKYPLIFSYYQGDSEALNQYRVPTISGDNLDVASYVSNGYLIFLSDMHFSKGENGIGVLNTIVSAEKFLSTFPWIDCTKLGIQGHSYGGWETNYLVTHSHLFAAACEAAGLFDLTAEYGEVYRDLGTADEQYILESKMYRGFAGLAVPPWGAPREYEENSPVFSIDSISTPLLAEGGKLDSHVSFRQQVELFVDMKKAGKAVWLLEYDNGGHSLFNADAKDYTIRMKQFFDHLLKGYPPPLWMTKGVPVQMKGIESGYELDPQGVCDPNCPVCRKKDYREYDDLLKNHPEQLEW